MAFIIEVDKDTFELNDGSNADFTHISDSKFHVLHGNQSYRVEIIESNFETKKITLEVNGNKYDVQIKDSYDQMVDKMGLLVGNSQKAKDIKAPMPGLIVDVMVVEGQEISEGTPLLILSAMKMENIILAQADGIIKSINVKKEDAVDKGQLVIEIE